MRTRFAIVLLAVLTLTAAAVPSGKPEDVGMSSERLQRVNEVIKTYIDAGTITGGVTMVSRKGKIAHFEAQGLMDVEAKTAMRKDAIFRMASMSKPVTGVAILILMEEGKLRLTDPVSRFIPEFKNPKVAILKPTAGGARGAGAGTPGQPPPAPEIYTVPAERELTIRDLMTHTNGLETGGPGSREGARISPRNTSSNLAAYVPTLGVVPLDFQPGSKWQYSALSGIETLGRIVEITSAMTFDQFLQKRIFEPLGMKDTAFYPTEDRLPRVVTLYERRPPATTLTRTNTPAWLATRTLFSGGGGLWSTAEDYMQFAQMLVNNGQLNGRRLLGPKTVDLMGSNHVGDLYSGIGQQLKGMGFGLTVEVVMDGVSANRRESNGSFGWDGAFGTHFWVDRKEQLVGLLMVQESNGQLMRDFENAVMQAIVE